MLLNFSFAFWLESQKENWKRAIFFQSTLLQTVLRISKRELKAFLIRLTISPNSILYESQKENWKFLSEITWLPRGANQYQRNLKKRIESSVIQAPMGSGYSTTRNLNLKKRIESSNSAHNTGAEDNWESQKENWKVPLAVSYAAALIVESQKENWKDPSNYAMVGVSGRISKRELKVLNLKQN